MYLTSFSGTYSAANCIQVIAFIGQHNALIKTVKVRETSYLTWCII